MWRTKNAGGVKRLRQRRTLTGTRVTAHRSPSIPHVHVHGSSNVSLASTAVPPNSFVSTRDFEVFLSVRLTVRGRHGSWLRGNHEFLSVRLTVRGGTGAGSGGNRESNPDFFEIPPHKESSLAT
nr:hypothetical protein Iba_chr11cCG5950 [Ipomoea batatas]GMD56702.1 hypothetical protein Iba_chr11eCG5680 [Ipomoea batatas]GME19650.1 hypothetical protein Iba_scaffold23446CG0020 [Ipomoea batatas]GME20552.1 hypothetical protein Iba_scaffold25448CG0010 [Ipomoea batatas]